MTLKEEGMVAWIGVDLDGTLAEYYGWKGPGDIGKPIEVMVLRVLRWLAKGKVVKIFTARAFLPSQIPPVKAWCKEHLGCELPVTCVKDFGMYELWDDRAVQVIPNTGERVDGKEKS